jgi:hypothetical protein
MSKKKQQLVSISNQEMWKKTDPQAFADFENHRTLFK